MQEPDKQPAVILLSGGLDSTTVAAIARSEGFRLHALTFAYGQRHGVELERARRVAAALGIEDHRAITVDPGVFAGSALTSRSLPVPKHDRVEEIGDGIPITYVPARNTIFLAYGLAFAESIGACDLFIGVNVLDYSGYPDCRPEYIAAFERMANLATQSGVEGAKIRIHAPLIRLTKAEIIRRGVALGVDYGLTHSCYDPAPNGDACGRCDSCLLRSKGFSEAGIADPTRYA